MASFNWSAFWAKLTGRSKTVVVPSVQPPTPTPTPAPTPPATPAPAPAVEPVLVPSVSSADAVDIRGATLLGPHARRGDPASASISCKLTAAKMEGGKLWLSYATVPSWPTDSDGTTCQNYLYWRGGDGKARGGWFERSGNGRRDRLLQNIHAGYLSGEQPPNGAPCWTCVVRRDFTERSNVVACGNWQG